LKERLCHKDIFKDLEEILFEKFVKGVNSKEEIYNNEEQVKIISPGRINIIGEHTDYNLGFSLATSVNRYCHIIGCRNHSGFVEVYSRNFKKICKFSMDDIKKDPDNNWGNHIKGIVKELLDNNYGIGGFTAVIDSDIPIGGGMSSSAAIEVGVFKLINEIFNLEITSKGIAHYCNNVENNFIGVRCGLLDQYSIVFGKKDYALFINFKKGTFEYVGFNLEDTVILIVDSREQRNLSETNYNKCRNECREAAEILSGLPGNGSGFGSLSDIDIEHLNEKERNLERGLFLRARHVITENKRVFEARDCMLKNEIKRLGEILTESHLSLRDDFKVSTERLDFLERELCKINGVYGARLMGAGFGGSVISIVKRDNLEHITDSISTSFMEKFNINPNFFSCTISDGTKRFI